MKLNVNQKKTVSVILADFAKLIFLSIVIGKFVSEVGISAWIFIIGVVSMFILLYYSIIILKE